MLFSLTNVLASFQGYINTILTEKLGIFIIVYLDDNLIYTNDDGNRHVTAVWWFLEQLGSFYYMPTWRNVDFITKKFGSSAI